MKSRPLALKWVTSVSVPDPQSIFRCELSPSPVWSLLEGIYFLRGASLGMGLISVSPGNWILEGVGWDLADAPGRTASRQARKKSVIVGGSLWAVGPRPVSCLEAERQWMPWGNEVLCLPSLHNLRVPVTPVWCCISSNEHKSYWKNEWLPLTH